MKVRRIDFSPDEWLAGTTKLSPYDRGVYITVCALIYSRGERIDAELLHRHLGVHGNALNASLARLNAAGKIIRNGSEIGQKRAEKELETAQKRAGKLSEKGRERKKNSGLESPRAGADARNHQPSVKKETSPYEEVSSLPARAASPPLPSQGDGDAALRASEGQEGEPEAPTVYDNPALKAYGLAALTRALDAVRGRIAVLDTDATEPPPLDPRLAEFRGRLQRLNAIVGEQLAGDLRDQAWTVLAAADELGDPLALPDQMAADLDAIERLHYREAAE